jgi:hypothetical protein
MKLFKNRHKFSDEKKKKKMAPQNSKSKWIIATDNKKIMEYYSFKSNKIGESHSRAVSDKCRGEWENSSSLTR